MIEGGIGKVGKKDINKRVKVLEKRLDALLSGETELKLLDPKEIAVAPRSKLRVRCE